MAFQAVARELRTAARGTIARVPFRAGGAVPGVEVLALADVRARMPAAHLVRPQRIEFQLFLLITSGAGWHAVDFERHAVSPGSLLVVQPGQVQQFDPAGGAEGTLILADPTFVVPDRGGQEPDMLAPGCFPAHAALPDALRAAFQATAAAIARETGAGGADPLVAALARARLHTLRLALLVGLRAGAPPPVPGRAAALVAGFRRLMEADAGRRRAVRDYAARLGCTERTLHRACQEVEGRPASAMLAARALLEAKRLLAHTDAPVAELAAQLGFAEPTNLVRFFRRAGGATPAAFRRGFR